MKKVFISVPMRGRTKENIEYSIKKMKDIARTIIEDEDIEFINTIVEEKPPYTTQKEAVWYLGKAIELLSQVDVLVAPQTDYHHYAPGCFIEKEVASRYGITRILIPEDWVYPQSERELELDCSDAVPQEVAQE